MFHSMKFSVVSITSLLFMTILWSCSWHNIEEDVRPVAPCDTLPAMFADTILPIIQIHCTPAGSQGGCHLPGNGARPPISDYNSVKGLVDAGRIQARVFDQNPSPMPPSGALPLNDCEKNLLQNWIEDGALDN